MKLANGGPDPTTGGEADVQASWYLDGKNLKDNIKKILIKFCVPAPIVFRYVNEMYSLFLFVFAEKFHSFFN